MNTLSSMLLGLTWLLLSINSVFATDINPEYINDNAQFKLTAVDIPLTYIATDIDLNIHQLIANQNQIHWLKLPVGDVININDAQAYWFVFDINNTGIQDIVKQINLHNSKLKNVSVFSYDFVSEEIFFLGEMGETHRLLDRHLGLANYTFPLTMPAKHSLRVYVRVLDDYFFQPKFALTSTSYTLSQQFQLNLFTSIIVSVLGLIALCCFLIYVALRDVCFLYFSGFSATLAWSYALYGDFFLWLMPSVSFTDGKFFLLLSIALAATFAAAFNNSYLRCKSTQPLIYKLNNVYSVSAILVICSMWLLPFLTAFSVIFLLSLCISATAVAMVSKTLWMKKASLKLFSLAWLLVFSQLFSIISKSNNWLDFHLIYQAHVSIMLVATLLFFAGLMSRLKLAQVLSSRAKQKAMQHYHMFYDIYQHAVEAHYTTTDKGEILRVNNAFVDILGYESYEQLIDENPNIITFYLATDDRAALLQLAEKQKKIIAYQAQWRRRDGREIWVSINLRYVKETLDGNVLIGSFMDITDKKKAETQLEFMASHDTLTGLINRREFKKRVSEVLLDSTGISHTLLYMDLDQFKVVNDTCGHKAGDILLRQLTDELRGAIDESDTIARLGGDEFGVLLYDMEGDEAFVQAYKLKQVVQDFRFVWENRVFTIGISIGMVEIHHANLSLDDVLSIADTACFTAKEKGRNRIHCYTETDEDVKRYHAEMERVEQINDALENNRFFLEYQTIFPINQIHGMHYELLIRMRDRQGNVVLPNSFLPAAERYHLMAHIDRWVINYYFNWLSQHNAHMTELDKASINLSGPSLSDDDMQMFILQSFERYKIPYNKICFEITESLAITQLDKTLDFIKTFKGLGCKFALDDFGSGFSSYGYLKNLPVDYLKIDGGFVKDMLIDPIDCAMVKSINEVAKAIGMQTVAEFVESPEILTLIKEIGVDYAQGYVINQPSSLDELIKQ